MGAPSDSDLRERLTQRLLARAGELGVRKVRGARRFPGGLSYQTFLVDVDTTGGREQLVLRREPEGGVFEPYDGAREAKICAALSGSPVPAPRPLYVEEDPAVLGRRFVLYERIEGTSFTHSDPRFDDEDLRQAVLDRFVQMLAEIHRAAVPAVLADAGPSSAGVAVGLLRQRLTAVEIAPQPVLRRVLDMLEEAAPPDHPNVLVHGDYRLSNLIWRDNDIVGVLDWELAQWSDPLADLAFTQIPMLSGWCSIQGEAAAAYAETAGFDLDPDRLMFWQAMELLKTVLIGMGGAPAVAQGRSSDLRLLSVATMAGMLLPPLLDMAAALKARTR